MIRRGKGKMEKIEIFLTGPARVVNNETTGTIYVKVEGADGTRRCFIVYSDIDEKEAKTICAKLNKISLEGRKN
jgi:hypothetical protein